MEQSDREQLILDAAATLILQHGYDKMTMGDVANVLGISRPLIYVHFKSKDALLEALILREMMTYGMLWFQYIDADPQGGTIGSVYRSILKALKETPILAAIVTRSEGTFGKYLRRSDNIFASMQTSTLMQDWLQLFQDSGVIRADVDIAAMGYIMDVMSAGIVDSSIVSDSPAPDYEILLETIADMLDRMLTPDDGGNIEAGKAIMREFAENARNQLARHLVPESEEQS